ncbi:MAG: response regulator [Candidatus Omnitrophota bacterium]
MIKLLVVDDEIDICDFVKNFFKERNFDVSVAYNGKEALRIMDTVKPQIVLLDLKMPVMDGMETLKRINKSHPEAKVIIVTAVEDTEKAEEAKRHNAAEYITKPLFLEQLERAVMTIAEQIKMGM